MKKKILFAIALISMFVFVFAVSAFAVDENQYVEFKVLLEGDTEYTTVYSTNSHDYWNPGVTMSYDFYTDAERTTVLDKTNIVKIDMRDNKVYTIDEKASPIKKSSITRFATFPGQQVNDQPVLTKVTHFYMPPSVDAVPQYLCKGWTALVYFDYGDANKIIDNAFENCTFTTLTIPKQIIQINNTAFKGCTNLTSLTFEGDVTTFGNAIFQNCTSLTNVNIDKLTKIGNSMFDGCTALTEFTIHDNITSLGSGAFKDCTNLTKLNISENSQISNKWNAVLQNCNKITSVYMPPLVTEMGENSFYGCSALETIVFPPNLEKISGGNNFYGCSKITKLAFPNTLTTIGAGNITHNITEIRYGNSLTSLGDGALVSKALERVYLPASLEKIGGRILGYSNSADSSQNITFIFTGTKEQAEALQSYYEEWTLANQPSYAPNNSKFYNAELVSAKDYDVNQTPVGFHLVYDYNPCDAFYGSKHNLVVADGNTCSGVCNRNGCGEFELLENPVHQSVWVFNGGDAVSFTAKITAEHKCRFCSTVEDSKAINAILYSNGISIDETDYTGIYEQIKVDTTALEAYSTLSGKQFDYGIFALAASESQTSAPIAKGENGKGVAVDQNTVFASFTGTEYTYLRIKITGIPNGGSIFCGAYLVIGDDIVYVSNKQEGKEVNKYTMVTEQA